MKSAASGILKFCFAETKKYSLLSDTPKSSDMITRQTQFWRVIFLLQNFSENKK